MEGIALSILKTPSVFYSVIFFLFLDHNLLKGQELV